MAQEISGHVACGGSIVQAILVVDWMVRPQAGFEFEATSLPGHLLHLMVSGRVRQEVSGRPYELGAGDLFWYHEDELVRGVVTEAPWTFYTVNFMAPALPAPAFESRSGRAGAGTQAWFAGLLDDWRDTARAPMIRELAVHSGLLALLADVWPLFGQNYEPLPKASLWWELETRVRQDLTRPASLDDLCRWSGCSHATIRRASLLAVGLPPMRRIKEIRMNFAQGLSRRSQMSVSEIARRVGYERVHEFSRDYKKRFGVAPSEDRAGGG